MARELDGAIAERSRKQLGLVTTGDLDALGVTRQQRRTLVARGVLAIVHRGVYRHCAHPVSWHQAVLAVVLGAGEGAVASHLTAAALWRLDGVARGPVEVTVPLPNRRLAPGDAVIHASTDLVLADVDRRHAVPRTTAARTLCDIAPQLPARRLEAALDDAERRGLVWRPQLRWRIAELSRRGRRGIPQVERLLDRTEGRPLGDSWLEQQALRTIAEAGLPVPRCQVTLRKAGGGVARVDLLWDPVRLVAELDGHGTHATRRQRQAGAERAARLALAGWRVVTFTYEDVVERPDYVVGMIRDHLTAAGLVVA